MKKILGLDLGTTSIGWAFVNEAENENEFILQVLERYVKDREHTIPSKLQEIVKVNFPDNSFLRLAENSSCSPDYIEKLVGWPTK